MGSWNALAWPLLVTNSPEWRPIAVGLLNVGYPRAVVGGVAVELSGAEVRSVKSTDLVNAWRKLVDEGLLDEQGNRQY